MGLGKISLYSLSLLLMREGGRAYLMFGKISFSPSFMRDIGKSRTYLMVQKVSLPLPLSPHSSEGGREDTDFTYGSIKRHQFPEL